MKALVHSKPNTLEYVDIPMPVRRAPKDIIIKMRAVGICGSDVHGFTGKTGRRIPPIVMGHEVAGEIFEVGEGTAFAVGDRVVIDSTMFCGNCNACRMGAVNLCSSRRVLGVSCDAYKQDGAMAEYFVVPERIVYKLPNNIDFINAALVEPASVSFHAVSLARVTAENTVLVVGAGVIGLLVVQALRIKGCTKIVVVDINSERLAIATAYGAEYVINSQKENPAKKIDALYGEQIVDISFEVVGVAQTVALAISAVKRRGKTILIGNVSLSVPVPLQDIVTGEKIIVGSCASAGESREVITHLSEGRLDVKRLITKVASLSEGERWFKELLEKKGTHVKIVLTNEQ